MIETIKTILGLASDFTDYDLYLAIICAVSVMWIVKSVITGIYQSVLHIFR